MSSTPSLPSSSLSSSVIRQDQYKYDAFLSFSGQDTRATITSHIYDALRKNEIPTFFDEDGLQTGDSISPKIMEAIEKSKVSVIVFSATYASSSWCMDELGKILVCWENNKQEVIPVFYHVCPSELQNQTGSVGEEFEKLSKKSPEDQRRYRDALTALSSITGLVIGSESKKFKSDAALVKTVVSEVREKLKKISLSTDHEGPVGLNPHVEEIISLLANKYNRIVVGICGEPGIGKTTLVRAVYADISSQYEGHIFFVNVDEEIQEGIAVLSLRILYKILKELDPKDGIDVGSSCKDILKDKKVFMVFDDVDKSRTIDMLIPIIHLCSSESRAIIITENRKALEECEVSVKHIHEVQRLTDGNDLKLFSSFAFEQGSTHDMEKERLSKEIVRYAKGNPLCLKTLGSCLRNKKTVVWESVLNGLQVKGNSTVDIHEVIQICYDELLGEKEKIIFTDLLMFEGKNKEDVKERVGPIYSGCEAVDALIDKSIITESSGKLHTHRLFRETAVNILKEKLPEIFRRDNVTEELNGSSSLLDIKAMVDILQKSKLGISKGQRRGFLSKKLSNKSCYITLSSSFNPKLLVDLELHNITYNQPPKSHFEVSKEHRLEFLCSELRPLSRNPMVELTRLRTMLLYNIIFKQPPKGILQILENLVKLYLTCTAIEEIPSSFCKLKTLSKLDLRNCFKLKRFPEISETMERLEYLSLSGAEAIQELPSSIEHLIGLRELELVDCKSLVTLPCSICNLRSLSEIKIQGCLKLTMLPILPSYSCNRKEILEDLGCASSFKEYGIENNYFQTPSPRIEISTPELPLCLQTTHRELPSSLEELDEYEHNMEDDSYYSLARDAILSTNSERVGLRKWLPQIKNLGKHHDHADTSGKSTDEIMGEFVYLSNYK